MTYQIVLLIDQQGHGTSMGDHRPVCAATLQTAKGPFSKPGVVDSNQSSCNHLGTLFAQSLDAQQHFSLNVNKHSGKEGT